MKKIYLLVVVLLASFILSCSSDDEISYLDDFHKSSIAWQKFKEVSKNSYEYTVSGGSVFTPYGWETTLTVLNGVLVQRHFRYTGNPTSIPTEELGWTESKDEINTHKGTVATRALTLDKVYEKAITEWLIARKDAKIFFEAKNGGLISSCGYVKNGCMDDCFIGIRIKSIKALNSYE